MTGAAIVEQATNDWDRRGLPGWTYHSEALLALELDTVFKTHWQIAGHVANLPNPGDYITFDLGPDRAVIIRGENGTIRAFHNLCRHRGSRVVPDRAGTCTNAIVCPFHGWVYNFDGSLRGPARPETYQGLDKARFGLRPIEVEVWMGFVFIRFSPGPQGSVAEHLRLYHDEFALYETETLVANGGLDHTELAVNWKSVRDVDNEGYHVPMAHPALQDLYGFTYTDYFYAPGLFVSKGTFTPGAGRRWSVRHYTRFSQAQPGLPEDRHQTWAYYGMFPNNVLFLSPESVSFYQELPIGTDRSLIRSASYRYREETREQRLARYLVERIDRDTYAEDRQLAIWSNEAMKSSAFEGFHLSDLEIGLRKQHDLMRALVPVMRLDHAPPADRMAAINAAMRDEAAAGSAAQP